MAEERLRQILEATLSAEKAVRQAGEAELRNLSSDPGISSSLLSCALSGGPYPYLSTHWSEAAEKFEPPSVPHELRPRIRQALFEGISNPSKGISGSCAYSVAIIAKYDWPDHWPNLMDDLVSMMRQGNSSQLEGAMEVVTEMVREDFGPDQLPTIASSLLPTLLDILRNEQIEWTTRGKTLDNFQEIVSMFTTIREEHPQQVKQAMDHFGVIWLGEMEKIVSRDLDSDLKRDPGLLVLRGNSFKVFHTLDKDFAKFFAPYRTHLVQIAIQNLTALIPHYQQYCISTSSEKPVLPDSYDETLVFDGLINDIFEFLIKAARHPTLKKSFIQVIDDQELASELLGQLLISMTPLVQMPSESIGDYQDDVNLFLADDDEEMGAFNIRSAGYDLAGSLFDLYPRAVATILQSILITKVHETIAARQAGHEDWWQPLEGMLAMLISLSDDIGSVLEADENAGRPPTIALGQLYSEVVASILNDSRSEESMIIQARSLLFAAAFAGLLPKDAVEAAFNTAIEVLEDSQAAQLSKMSAIKAIKNFCRHVSPEVVQPRSQHIMSILLPNMRDLSDEMLYLVMETLRAILALDKNALNPETVRVMAEMVFDTWLQNSTDPVATAIVEELLEVVAGTSAPPVVHSLVITLGPRLAATIASPVTSANEHLPAEAVQLANSLIRTRGGPIEAELVSTVSAAVMDCLAKTDDMHVVQHGIVHLTQIVRKDCDKLLQCPNGASGMDTILQLLSKFLSPEFPETGGIYVGDLIIHLLRKASSAIGPILPGLLQALVIRLATAKLQSFIEALVLPFAYLFGTEHTQATLDLLISLPNPDPAVASSALQLVLQKWCELSDEISGSWNIRVNALGLARLYANPSPALRDTPVRGDLIINEANRDVIITRSKARANPAQYTPTPFIVKCLKLILKELQTYKTTAGGKGKKVSNNTIDLEEDDGDEEWDDDDDGLGVPEGKGEFDFLSSWLDDDGGGDNEAQDDDEDLKSDPVAQIDMVDHLTNVLRHCYTTNENGMHEHISGLNEVEKGTLRGVLTL